MKHSNLFKSFFLALLAAMFPQLASAYEFMVDGLCYNKNDNGSSVTLTYQSNLSESSYLSLSGNITIPSTVTYEGITYSVTSIGEYAFSGCIGLTSVTIPNSVTEIGSSAFYGCTGLTSVTIPNSVTKIGEGVFIRCTSLTSVAIPNSLRHISENSFSYCSSLASVTIPNSVTSIGNSAFSWCSSLTSVTIPNSVTSIGDEAFYICSSLNSVTIPNSVTSIGTNAFSNTPWDDNLPDGLIYAGLVAYKYKGSMPNGTSIEINEGTKGIAGGCFSYCRLLASVTIPNSVISIGNKAFSNCTSLISVIIPNSVTSIGSNAFSGCTGLASVSISNSVTSISDYTFKGCTSLASVIIPYSVTSIGYAAFSGCTGLTSITIPNSVASIDYYAFASCSGLTSMTLSGQGAWDYNSENENLLGLRRNLIDQIKNVKIGSGVTSFRNFRFSPDTINCYASTPPTCSSSTFANYNGELHVPTPSLVSYFTANYWQNFNNLINDLNEKVTLDKTSISLNLWQTLVLTATVVPDDGAVLWSSSNPSVASVDESGLVTALDEGECDIFATLETNAAAYASCHIIVSYPEFTLSLSSDSLEMKIGEDNTIIAIISPDSIGLTPTWSTSNKSVATVDNGVVVAVSEGECDITARVLDKEASCHIKVTYPEVSLSLNVDTLEMILGENSTLIATIYPDNLGFVPVWATSDESVATVDNGIVTTVGEGECDISATVRDKTVTCHVIVTEIYDVTVTLNIDKAILGANQMLRIYPSCSPDVPVELVVSSSDPNVALARVVNRSKAPSVGLLSFSEKGMAFAQFNSMEIPTTKAPTYASEKAIVIVGVQNGTATINVTTADGQAEPAVLELRVVDVDNDCIITAGDITCLYNYLLNGDDSFIATSDIDGDGTITAADITVIYNLLLGN